MTLEDLAGGVPNLFLLYFFPLLVVWECEWL